MAAGIEDEPALSGTPHAWFAGDDAIGDEPALSESPAAVRDKACRDAAVREMWANRAHAIGVSHFLWLCVASGAFAVICALVTTAGCFASILTIPSSNKASIPVAVSAIACTSVPVRYSCDS